MSEVLKLVAASFDKDLKNVNEAVSGVFPHNCFQFTKIKNC